MSSLVLAAAVVLQPALLTAGNAPKAAAPLAFEELFGGPFTLTDHKGNQRTEQDFHGKFMLIYFGYTACPSICPLNLQHMADALELLEDAGTDIKPVFVTVDPARDTQQVLRDYLAAFGPRFIGLTGTERQIRAVAKAYRLHRRKVVEAGAEPQDYLVDHASLTHLIGPDGKFRTLFAHDTPGEVMAKRIKGYLKE